jgi:hypothetical protein
MLGIEPTWPKTTESTLPQCFVNIRTWGEHLARRQELSVKRKLEAYATRNNWPL